MPEDAASMVRELRDILGAALVGYMASTEDTATVERWIDGEETPPADATARLRVALSISRIILTVDPAPIVRAWFLGMKEELNGVSPAELLVESEIADAEAALRAAAHHFLANG